MLAVAIEKLEKTYPNGVQAVKGINLNVEQGDFFALLGPNGAGKSTTIGIISSLVNKTKGKVEIFGHNIDNDLIAAKTCMGLVPQEMNFNIFEKVVDIVVNQAGYYGIGRKEALARSEHYLRKLNLWDKRNHMSRTLSGGMKRRLMIARALIHQPQMLILDEPTAGVDIELRRSTWEFLQEINQQGTTIILTTHYLEEAEYLCNGIAIIDEGEIVTQTTVKDLLRQLKNENIILDLAQATQVTPDIPYASCKLLEPKSLEITFPKERTYNELFAALSAQGIIVDSMRNKANRLEELFLNLINRKPVEKNPDDEEENLE